MFIFFNILLIQKKCGKIRLFSFSTWYSTFFLLSLENIDNVTIQKF